MKSLLMFIMAILTLVVLVLGLYYIYEERTFTVRTKAHVITISPANTYVFSSPACGSNVRLTVFCNNSRGFGVPSVQVRVGEQGGAYEVQAVRSLTNDVGEAIFDIRAFQSGNFPTSITCGDVEVKEQFILCLEK